MLDQGGYFEELVQAAEFAALSRDEKRNYLNSVKMKGDYQNTIDFAREQGFEQGHEAGVAEGLTKAKADIARNLAAMGLTPNQIAKATGLTEEAVKAL